MSQSTTATSFERAVDALIDGDIETLRLLLQATPELARARSERDHRATLLHYAAANGVENERQRVPANSADIVRLLLDAGADPAATADIYSGGAGSTPMVMAVSSSHVRRAGSQVDFVRALCEAGANPNGIDDDGMPLATALVTRDLTAAQTLADCGARVDNLVFAAGVGQLDTVRALLEAVDFRYSGPFEDAYAFPAQVKAGALVMAAAGGYLAIMRLLLQNGADITLPVGPEMSTALHEAARRDDTALIAELIERGAALNQGDNQQFTPLHWAAWFAHVASIRLLVERGAPLEALSMYGATPLDAAVYAVCSAHYPPADYLPALRTLCESGANPRAVSPFPTCQPDINTLLRAFGAGL